MKGYVRRKITYNIGKGGKTRAPTDKRGYLDNTAISIPGEPKQKHIACWSHSWIRVEWEYVKSQNLELVSVVEINNALWYCYRRGPHSKGPRRRR